MSGRGSAVGGRGSAVSGRGSAVGGQGSAVSGQRLAEATPRPGGEVGPNTRLNVTDLTIRTRRRELVQRVCINVAPGERVALIGESGSGKTLTAAAIMGLLPENLRASGRVDIGPMTDVLNRSDKELAAIRGLEIAMVFQEPMTALDPLMRVGDQVGEAFALHSRRQHTYNPNNAADSKKGKKIAQVANALAEVGLPPETATAYPHQLSGGQRQRVLIAMALANQPRFLIADEPTTALDSTVQAQILELLSELVQARGAGLLFISHDLDLVSKVANRVYVMQHGRIVEAGPVREILGNPQHQYTRELVAASDLGRLNLNKGYRVDVNQQRWRRVRPLSQLGAPPGRNSIRLRERWVAPIAQLPETPFENGIGAAQGKSGPVGPPRDAVVTLNNVTKTYTRRSGWLGKKVQVAALRGVSFSVAKGERFGIVGESGSGKTTALALIAGIAAPTSGSVTVLQQPSTQTRAQALVQLVFQDPKSSLDPRIRVGDIVAEPLLSKEVQQRIPAARTKAGRRDLVAEMLTSIGISPEIANNYPHELSGGQRQRVSIARALISKPQILLADEPVSALDVTVRAQVLQLLAAEVTKRDLTLIIVSHDLAVIQHLCDRVAIMKDGEIVEQGPTAEVWANPKHPYTRQLQAAAS